MVGLTAWSLCPEHGPFPVQMGLDARELIDIQIVDSATSCPVCGRVIPMVDGRYDVATTGTTTLTATSPESAAMIQELGKQLLYMQRVAADRRLSDVEAQKKLDAMAERAAAQHPEYAPVLREKVIGQPRKKARRALKVIGLAAAFIATADGVIGFAERTGEVVSGIVEQIERGQEPTLLPEPTSPQPLPERGPDPAQLPTTAPEPSAGPESPSSPTAPPEGSTRLGRPERRG